jgi:type IV pilus assembly protein PilN
MRISVNLATRPFVELRPLFARLRLVMIVLALVAVGLGVGLHALNAKAKVATAQMTALKAETAGYTQQRTSNEARMRQPQNQSVLARSQFLNAVFAKKSFSWTAVMMDLEHVLPNGVQVTAIEPGISKEGEVSIRLRVTGDRDRAIELVRNLESSQRFVKPRLGGETALTAEKANAFGRNVPPAGIRNASISGDAALGNGVEFEIFSDYNPLNAVDSGKGAVVSKPAPKSASTPAPKVPKPKAAPLPPARPTPALPTASKGGKR